MSVRKAVMVLYRVCWIAFFVMVAISLFTEPPFPYWVTWVPAVAAVALSLTTGRRGRAAVADPRPAVEVEPPVTGRWTALNSPADKVPSHGVHAYGQTYAIDIVSDPQPLDREDASAGPGSKPGPRSKPVPAAISGSASGTVAAPRPGREGEAVRTRPMFRPLWPVARRNHHFPAYGSPVLAVADGTVVHASDGRRDHLSRNSFPALVYLMLIEASVRDVLGAGALVGNHVVLDLGDGTYAMYAHLRHGSLQVRAGETVRVGQPLAECGNSGNSTEPHVHFQLMDNPDLDVAVGIPFTWRGIGVPANGEAFTVGAPVSGSHAVRPGGAQAS
ncbi:M23 family metallopeptidase [Streptomyces sp. NPDC058382]|uniref:M23 family metallopeptidase n=1 Tax=unclassified Streptomyces TaxID=2593676 RepID=UPI00362C272A